jgi:hypothetical protein|tara:strand:+ start:333 stop:1100 length:768 start_codon:yes stop_codon:yes gene_type:complete
MDKYKNLYINGCSYTFGHSLSEELKWPYMLSKKLDIDTFINDSQNANSLDTIMDISFFNLLNLNPKDTLVVIGLTWIPRFAITYNNMMTNQGPADFENNEKINFEVARRPSRVSPIPTKLYSKNVIEITKHPLIQSSKEINGFNDILNKHVSYLKSLLLHDANFTQNLKIKYIKSIILMQNYLENNNFNYYFIKFQNDAWEDPNLDSLYNNINLDKIIDLQNIDKDKLTSHPSSKGCLWAVDNIIKKIKEDEAFN